MSIEYALDEDFMTIFALAERLPTSATLLPKYLFIVTSHEAPHIKVSNSSQLKNV